ncbi:MAG TPA: AbrB/MazE/SpoVT family DNA-binding domain-containing protein [Candidatus Pacearchaeota archaeon]|nr:hypothetical protein BMS3Abin17_00005 [archaeon BMS3Abin17]HDK41778.1 AbrB/MazE/SpoVT family DNA-binding domain-containing protein [Candidatus Pacearchaeota archaeon]
MKSLTKTRTVGGSLIITIPSEIVKSEMLRENELIEVEVKKAKKDFFGSLKGIGSFTKEDELKGQFEE